VAKTTLPSKPVKTSVLAILGIGVAIFVNFSGMTAMIPMYLDPKLFGVLLVGAGLTAILWHIRKNPDL